MVRWGALLVKLSAINLKIHDTLNQHCYHSILQPSPGYMRAIMIKRQSDGVLHQMSWPPKSPSLNTVEIVWDELDCGVLSALLRLLEEQVTTT